MRSIGLSFLLLIQGTTVEAATRTWTGASGSAWSNASNWDSGVPAPGDTLVFPAGAHSLTLNNDLPQDLTYASTSFDDSYTLSGNSMQLSAGVHATRGRTDLGIGIKLAAPQSWSVGKDAAVFMYPPLINLNDQSLTIDSTCTTHPWPEVDSCLTIALGGLGNVAITGTGRVQILHSPTMNGTVTNRGVLLVWGWMPAAVVNEGALELGPPSFLQSALTNRAALISQLATVHNVTMTEGSVFHAPFYAAYQPTRIDVDAVTVNVPSLDVSTDRFRTPGEVLLLIRNNGTAPVTGTFASLPDGAVVTAAGLPQRFRISYAGLNGKSVTLTAIGELPTMKVSRSPAVVYGGRQLTFTAGVSGAFGTPTGTVTLSGPATTIAPLDHDGFASLTVRLNEIAAPNWYDFVIVYTGDEKYTGASQRVEVLVSPEPVPPRRRAVRH